MAKRAAKIAPRREKRGGQIVVIVDERHLFPTGKIHIQIALFAVFRVEAVNRFLNKLKRYIFAF